jgi:hypothetical protein
VSTNPRSVAAPPPYRQSQSSLGGISGNRLKPMSARPVVNASVLRQSRYTVGHRRNSTTSTTIDDEVQGAVVDVPEAQEPGHPTNQL